MKRKILFPIVMVAIIAALIVYANITSKIVYNDEMTTGNTPGNLMNSGYYCEEGDTIYFSNLNDYEKLYSMDLNCKNFKRLGTSTVSDINCAGKYIYYAGRSNKYKAAKAKNSGSALSSGGVGLFRSDRKGKHIQTLYGDAIGSVSLFGNYLYYQHYTKKDGLYLYKTKIDEKEGKCLFESPVSPIGLHNGSLYFCGTKNDHKIYKMSLKDDSYNLFYDGNCSNVLVFQNKIYFIDLNNNYALTRLDLDGSNPEVLVNDHVLTYNFSLNGNFMYYQIDDQENSCICQMDMETKEHDVLLKGNFCNINTTSNYVFFREFDTDNEYVIADEKNPKLNLFDPPVIK